MAYQKSLLQRSLILLAVSLSLMTSIAAAAETAEQTWPVEQRCIPDPVLPPDDWSCPGTILMSGYAGIHGIQMDWETSHVIVFFRKDANGDYPFYGGQLSPDARWYAAPIGET